LNKETIFTPTKQVPLESLHSPKELDNSQTKREFNHENDYYLTNFENAIKSVLNETAYSCLLNEYDIQTINKFSRLESKRLMFFHLQKKVFEKDQTFLHPPSQKELLIIIAKNKILCLDFPLSQNPYTIRSYFPT